jgi:hypothetical protein
MRGVALFFLILFLTPEKYLYMVSFAKSPLKPRFARTCAKYSVKVNFVIGRGFSPFGDVDGLIQQLVVMYFSALTNLSSLNGSASEYDYN